MLAYIYRALNRIFDLIRCFQKPTLKPPMHLSNMHTSDHIGTSTSVAICNHTQSFHTALIYYIQQLQEDKIHNQETQCTIRTETGPHHKWWYSPLYNFQICNHFFVPYKTNIHITSGFYLHIFSRLGGGGGRGRSQNNVYWSKGVRSMTIVITQAFILWSTIRIHGMHQEMFWYRTNGALWNL